MLLSTRHCRCHSVTGLTRVGAEAILRSNYMGELFRDVFNPVTSSGTSGRLGACFSEPPRRIVWAD